MGADVDDYEPVRAPWPGGHSSAGAYRPLSIMHDGLGSPHKCQGRPDQRSNLLQPSYVLQPAQGPRPDQRSYLLQPSYLRATA